MKILTLRRSESFGFSRRKEEARRQKSVRGESPGSLLLFVGLLHDMDLPEYCPSYASGGSDIGFGLRLLFSIFAPLQGLLNALVYIRPRFSRNREKNPSISIFQALVVTEEQDHQLGAFGMRSTIKPATLAEDDESGQVAVEKENKVDEAA
jgi:hypothetical protein